MRAVKIGVAGLGFGAAVHVPALASLPGVRVVAIAGRRLRMAESVAARAGIPAAVEGWERLLEQEIDAVTLALPPLENERACHAALRKGLPVLSEKPLAASATAAHELASLASGVTNAIDFEFAELEAFQLFKRLVSEQEYGAVRHVQVTWLVESGSHARRLWSWKTDAAEAGGVTSLLGSHVLYLLEWIFGRVSRLVARCGNFATQDFAPAGGQAADDRVDLWTEHVGGMTGSITWGNACPGGPGHRWECICDHGTITLQNTTRDYVFGFELFATTRTGRDVLFRDAGGPGDGRVGAVRLLSQRFIDAVRNRTSTYPDFNAGARVQELIVAVRAGGTQEAGSLVLLSERIAEEQTTHA